VTKAEIQLVRSLADKRARQETGLFVAEGEKLVGELLESDFTVRQVFYTDRVSHLKTPTGCLALVEIPRWEFKPEALRGRLVLALDEVQNPGNLGTIIRLADWFGIGDILCSEGTADCFNPKVVQATMGAITRVRVHYGDLRAMVVATATAGLATPDSPAGKASFPVYGTFLEGENIYRADLTNNGIIVLGSEGRGISKDIEALVNRKLFIPPFPRDASTSESLNVSIAAAIVCSEFRRR
jgi:TrmH family RNA methyltransferase